MQVHMHISPDMPDGAPFAAMNPGMGRPFGVMCFSGDAYVALMSDDEARRVIEAAEAVIAMRKMLGTPHAFEPAGPGGTVQPGWCLHCGMLGDWADHAEPEPAGSETEPAPAVTA